MLCVDLRESNAPALQTHTKQTNKKILSIFGNFFSLWFSYRNQKIWKNQSPIGIKRKQTNKKRWSDEIQQNFSLPKMKNFGWLYWESGDQEAGWSAFMVLFPTS